MYISMIYKRYQASEFGPMSSLTTAALGESAGTGSGSSFSSVDAAMRGPFFEA